MFILTPKKICTQCGIEKSITEFEKHKRGKYGVHSWCKVCKNKHNLKLKSAPDKKAAKAAYDRRLRLANPEGVNERIKRWMQENPGKGTEYGRLYRERHPDKRNETQRKQYWKDPERARVRAVNNRANRVEKAREYMKKWSADNPIKRVINQANRRARELGNGGTVTAQEWQALKEFYDFTCLCCRRQEPEIELTHDHVKPLVMGGENTIANSQPLCRSCNSRKGKKWIDYR